jgi:hypothetical protein
VGHHFEHDVLTAHKEYVCVQACVGTHVQGLIRNAGLT